EASRRLVEETLQVELLLAEGRLERLPAPLPRALEAQAIRSWVGGYRSVLALAAAALRDVGRSRAGAAAAERVTRAADVQLGCRRARLACERDDAEAAEVARAARAAGMADVLVQAAVAQPALAEPLGGPALPEPEGDVVAHMALPSLTRRELDVL